MNRRIRNNNEGIVSILVTIIFTIVIGLIIVGFSEASRNQARQTLDNQLSSGSYYAAQSGINELENILKSPPASLSNQQSCCPISSCTSLSFSSASGSTITCYSYNIQPAVLTANLGMNQGSIIHVNPIKPSGGGSDYRLTFSWTASGAKTPNGCQKLTLPTYDLYTYTSVNYNATCSPGAIKADMSVDPSVCRNNPDERGCLYNNSHSLFMIPQRNKVARTATHQGVAWNTNIIAAQSTVSPYIVYTQRPSPFSTTVNVNVICSYTTNYCEWINLRALYAPSTVSVSATDITTITPVAFKNSQAQIDVTAKTQNVVRRLVANVNISSSSTPTNVPNFAIQATNSICKRITVDNDTGKKSLNFFTFEDPSVGSTDKTDCIFP